jgi:dienelactone hydrolase
MSENGSPLKKDALPAVDQRYTAYRHGDMHFEFPCYETLAAWEARAAWLREHIRVVLGLWPPPERDPLRARIHGRITYDDYVVEKVTFESWPGFLCTGNLYKPKAISGPVPGILNPHGHAKNGRLTHSDSMSIRARCITFARMGMLAFSYDMVGYHDSLQVPRHRFATPRGALWGIHPLALQTWNSVRAIDFLQSLAEVDPDRIGCTGASGGGTQTFMVTAIDPRIKIAAPVNMVSAHMQGGCVGENAPGLRTDTYNVEIAALAAPRPLLLVSATGDWTVNTPEVEYPAIRSIYQLYDADDRLAWAQEDAEHNYNAESRHHVYRWFARWFLGDVNQAPAEEAPFIVEPDERLRIFPSGELPPGLPKGEMLADTLRTQIKERLNRLAPRDQATLESSSQVTRRRLEHVLMARAPASSEVLWKWEEQAINEPASSRLLWLGRQGSRDRVPGIWFSAQQDTSRTALLIHDAGHQGLYNSLGQPNALVRGLLEAGWHVLLLDPFLTGPKIPRKRQIPHEDDWFEMTFNPPRLGRRVQDILTALAFLSKTQEKVSVIGLNDAGPWAALAIALSDVDCQAYVDLSGLTIDSDEGYMGDLFAPVFRAFGGLKAVLPLIAPHRMHIAGLDASALEWTKKAFELQTAGDHLSWSSEPPSHTDILDWSE